jgi:hypothetical protein
MVFTIDESFFSPTFCFRNQRVDLESWSGIVRGASANIADVREVTPKICESGGDNDPIKMFKIYAEKRPLDFSGPEDPFYLAPRTIPLHDSRSTRWFLKQKVGEKKLSSIVKTMKALLCIYFKHFNWIIISSRLTNLRCHFSHIRNIRTRSRFGLSLVQFYILYTIRGCV